MDSLPEELLRLIACYLPLEDRKNLRLTCKAFSPVELVLKKYDRVIITSIEELLNYPLWIPTLTIRLDQQPQEAGWQWTCSGDFMKEIELEICEHEDNVLVIKEVFDHFTQLHTIRIGLKMCCRGLSHGETRKPSNESWIDLMGPQYRLKHLAFDCYQTGGFAMMANSRNLFAKAAAKKWGMQLEELYVGYLDSKDSTYSEIFTPIGPQIAGTDIFFGKPNSYIVHFSHLTKVAFTELVMTDLCQNLTHIHVEKLLLDGDGMHLFGKLENLQAIKISEPFHDSLTYSISLLPHPVFRCLKIFIGFLLQDMFQFLPSCLEVLYVTAPFVPEIQKLASLTNLRCLNVTFQYSCDSESEFEFVILNDSITVVDADAVVEINKLRKLVQLVWSVFGEPIENLNLLQLPMLEDLYLNMELSSSTVTELFRNCPRLRSLYCIPCRGSEETYVSNSNRNVYNARQYTAVPYSIFRMRRKMFFFRKRGLSQRIVARRLFNLCTLGHTYLNRSALSN